MSARKIVVFTTSSNARRRRRGPTGGCGAIRSAWASTPSGELAGRRIEAELAGTEQHVAALDRLAVRAEGAGAPPVEIACLVMDRSSGSMSRR
jgi:hypothetical protein